MSAASSSAAGPRPAAGAPVTDLYKVPAEMLDQMQYVVATDRLVCPAGIYNRCAFGMVSGRGDPIGLVGRFANPPPLPPPIFIPAEAASDPVAFLEAKVSFREFADKRQHFVIANRPVETVDPASQHILGLHVQFGGAAEPVMLVFGDMGGADRRETRALPTAILCADLARTPDGGASDIGVWRELQSSNPADHNAILCAAFQRVPIKALVNSPPLDLLRSGPFTIDNAIKLSTVTSVDELKTGVHIYRNLKPSDTVRRPIRNGVLTIPLFVENSRRGLKGHIAPISAPAPKPKTTPGGPGDSKYGIPPAPEAAASAAAPVHASPQRPVVANAPNAVVAAAAAAAPASATVAKPVAEKKSGPESDRAFLLKTQTREQFDRVLSTAQQQTKSAPKAAVALYKRFVSMGFDGVINFSPDMAKSWLDSVLRLRAEFKADVAPLHSALVDKMVANIGVFKFPDSAEWNHAQTVLCDLLRTFDLPLPPAFQGLYTRASPMAIEPSAPAVVLAAPPALQHQSVEAAPQVVLNPPAAAAEAASVPSHHDVLSLQPAAAGFADGHASAMVVDSGDGARPSSVPPPHNNDPDGSGMLAVPISSSVQHASPAKPIYSGAGSGERMLPLNSPALPHLLQRVPGSENRAPKRLRNGAGDAVHVDQVSAPADLLAQLQKLRDEAAEERKKGQAEQLAQLQKLRDEASAERKKEQAEQFTQLQKLRDEASEERKKAQHLFALAQEALHETKRVADIREANFKAMEAGISAKSSQATKAAETDGGKLRELELAVAEQKKAIDAQRRDIVELRKQFTDMVSMLEHQARLSAQFFADKVHKP